MSVGIYTQDTTDILDLFYANGDSEPDWAAIQTRLHTLQESPASVMTAILRAFYALYEDPAAFATVMYRLQKDLPET